MGQVADEVLDGKRCNLCSRPMPDGESPGYPRPCEDCKKLLPGWFDEKTDERTG